MCKKISDVIHRDLKPENFVFASKKVESEIVLIDYGCARIIRDQDVIEDVVGTYYLYLYIYFIFLRICD